MGNTSIVVSILNGKRALEQERERDRTAAFYSSFSEVPERERQIMKKSLKYNIWKSLLIFGVACFVLELALTWCFIRIDPYEQVTGYRLMGVHQVTGIVQEDGESFLVKDPNAGQTVLFSLEEYGLDPSQYRYGDEVACFFKKETEAADSGYILLAVIPEKQAGHLENSYWMTFGVLFAAIIVIGLVILYIRRHKYISWYPDFYQRMEKFCSVYGVYHMYPNLDTTEAFIAYGTGHKDSFVSLFSKIELTREEIRSRKKKMVLLFVTAAVSVVVLITVVMLITGIQSLAGQRANEERTASVRMELASSVSGETEALGDASEYYNFTDMIDRMKASFPDEDIYYCMVVSEKYISFSYTTEKKTNVYLDRYVPVEGKIGEQGLEYKIDISMVSNAIQPDDILNTYTGIIEQ